MQADSLPIKEPTVAGRSSATAIELPSSPDVVWRVLTDAQELARWFPLSASVKPGAGGEVVWDWGELYHWPLKIDGLQPKSPQYDMATLLIELGADLEAEDDLGRTPLAAAMLQNDVQAMRLLKAAGAQEPQIASTSGVGERMDALSASMRKQVTPMLCVTDVDAAVAWYRSLGFTLNARYPETGGIGWAAMSFGKVELMLQGLASRSGNQIALWFHTRQLEELYEFFKGRQLSAAHAALAGTSSEHPGITFMEDLYEPFYGGRQFSLRDVNGFELVFQAD